MKVGQLLKEEAMAIGVWGKKQDIAKDSSCVCENNSCQIVINKFSPELLLKKQSVCSLSHGPNCWNTSLVSAGLANYSRYSSDDEIKLWMNSPLCTKRKTSEPREAGDIIAIRNIKGDEVHGFVYLSENLSFSKNGFHKKSVFSLQSPENVYSLYEVEKKCQGVEESPKSGCTNYSNIFQCISFDEYLEKSPLKNKEQDEYLKQLKTLECTISDQSQMQVMSAELVNLAHASLKLITELAKKEFKNSIDPDEKFIWEVIHLRANAIIEQNTILQANL